MGFWDRITGRPKPAPVVEERFGDGWGSAGFGLSAYAGRSPMAPHLAETLSTVVACVELIAGSIASLPAALVIDTPAGREPAPASAPAWCLLTRPNRRQSWPAFVSWLVAEYLLRGNGLARIEIDGRGAPLALWPVPWGWVLPRVLSGAAGARLVFDRVSMGPEVDLLGIPPRLLDSDVMHVAARTDHGVIGRSVLSRCASPVHEGLEMQTAASATWQNGLRPSGIYSMEGTMDDPARKRFRERISEMNEGSSNAGRILILDRGGKFIPVTMSSVDAQFLESRAFSVEDLARLFGVPSVLLQIGQRLPVDLAPFTSALASQALAPIVSLIEAEFDHAVLPAGQHLSIDMSGLLRGSYAAAVSALAVGKQSGIFTANDARKSLGLPPLEGGDVLVATGTAPSWPADAHGMPHLGPSPGPTGGGLPHVGTHEGEGAA